MKENNERCVNNPGQPTTLTKAVASAVIENVRRHLSLSNAARLAGQSPSTVITWRKRGYDDLEKGLENDFVDFARNVGQAQAEKVTEFMDSIASGKNENWKALAWLLEKCCPEDFGRDNELYKQLLNDYKMLAQSLLDQNRGVIHGTIPTNTLNHSPTH